MKDSQGNEFGIEDRLKSSEMDTEIHCQDINEDVATMVWLDELQRRGRSSFFNINQKELLNSKWVKIKKGVTMPIKKLTSKEAEDLLRLKTKIALTKLQRAKEKAEADEKKEKE